MKVLVTGGAGYIGCSLIRELEQSDVVDEIVIYDNLSRKNYSIFTFPFQNPSKIKLIEADLLNSTRLKKAVQDNVDLVIHLAAKATTPFADTDVHHFDQVNHWGSAQLANALDKSSVKKVIVMSSSSVYGGTEEVATESTLLHPESFYAVSKLDGERQFDPLKEEKNITILRASNVFGYNPAIRIDAVINKFMYEAHFNKLIKVHGDGQQKRSYIQVDDLATVVMHFVENDTKGGIYNVSEFTLSINDIVDHMVMLFDNLEINKINFSMKMRSNVIQAHNDILPLVNGSEEHFRSTLESF